MENKFKIIVVSIFLVFAVILVACNSQPAPVETVPPATPIESSNLSAVLSEITGKVEIRQAGQDTFAPAAADSFLNENGQALTGGDGRARLDLSTGTIVRVAPASLFTLTLNEPSQGSLKTRLQLELGKLYIILNGGSMEVETPTGTAAVRGSYMSVTYDAHKGEVKVTCLEGNCSLTNAAGSVSITAGQTAVISGAGQPPQVGEMSDQEIQDWLNNNPEAEVVVAALIDDPVATEIPATEEVPSTQEAPTETVLNPPLVFAPPVIKRPAEPKEELPLIPTVVISNIVPTSTVFGQPLTLTIKVLPSSDGPIPTGSVKALANGTPICNASLDLTGTAACIGGFPAAGLYSLIAEYSGDGIYPIVQAAAFEYLVNKASTTTTITTLPANPVQKNVPVGFLATVDNVAPGAGLPTGKVTFSDGVDSCVSVSAPWACNIIFSNSGSRPVIASYSGDANFNSSNSASVAQDVLSGVDSEFFDITGPISIMLMSPTECSQAYSVKVLDVDGVNEVKMEYSLDNTFSIAGQSLLTSAGANIWQGNIIVPASAMDIIYWRFIAVDGLSNSTFFGGVTPYTDGYPGGPVHSAYSFSLTSTFTPPCVP